MPRFKAVIENRGLDRSEDITVELEAFSYEEASIKATEMAEEKFRLINRGDGPIIKELREIGWFEKAQRAPKA